MLDPGLRYFLGPPYLSSSTALECSFQGSVFLGQGCGCRFHACLTPVRASGTCIASLPWLMNISAPSAASPGACKSVGCVCVHGRTAVIYIATLLPALGSSNSSHPNSALSCIGVNAVTSCPSVELLLICSSVSEGKMWPTVRNGAGLVHCVGQWNSQPTRGIQCVCVLSSVPV